MGQRKSENSEEEFPPSWLDWDALGHDIAIMKAPAKVRLFRVMSISATRNNREDFPNSMCLNVKVGMLTEKLPTLTTIYKIYEGTGL